MRRPSQELTEKLRSYRIAGYDSAGIPNRWHSYRELCGKELLDQPEAKIASLSRIVRSAPGVSLDEENEIRKALGMEEIEDPIGYFDTRTQRIISKEGRPRPKRSSTDFSADIYQEFRDLKEEKGLTNDQLLKFLLTYYQERPRATNY